MPFKYVERLSVKRCWQSKSSFQTKVLEEFCKNATESSNIFYLSPTMKRELKVQHASDTLMEFFSCILRQDLFAAAFKFMMNCVDQQADRLVLIFRSLSTWHVLSGRDFRLYSLTLQSQYLGCVPILFNFVCSNYVKLSQNFCQIILVTIRECCFKAQLDIP